MLEAIELARSFGARVAVDGISFDVARGRLTGFVGPNGAGKTTTLRMLMGITEPDRGELRVDGRPVDDAERACFGYLPEQRGLYMRMRVREHLVYLARLRGRDSVAADAAARHWLRRLGLESRGEDRIQELSHGNQQRVQLAAALVHDPDYVLLDEPFSGLDRVGVSVLSEVLHECAESGRAVLFSSHQLDLVESLCDTIWIVDRGRIVASGTMDELAAERPRLLVVEVDGASVDWALAQPGVTVLDSSGSRVRLLLADDANPQDVLASALEAGPVVHFGFDRPALSEIFLETLVAT